VDRAADLGAELFLLDDGWFGTAYPRHDDTVRAWATGMVDRAKFPDGLQPVIDHTLDRPAVRPLGGARDGEPAVGSTSSTRTG
jgi:hypothetical protein